MNEFWREARLKLFSYAVAALFKLSRSHIAPYQFKFKFSHRAVPSAPTFHESAQKSFPHQEGVRPPHEVLYKLRSENPKFG